MSRPDAVVFQLNSGLNNGGGFFSVFFFMCNAYLHAASLGIPFYIEHVGWPYTFRDGWHDYFTSLKLRPGFPMYRNILRSTHMANGIHPHFRMLDYSLCIQSIFALRPELKERINAVKRQIGSEYTAVFVRRGDKSREVEHTPFSSILAIIPYEPSTVFFIQSDDYTVVEEARASLPANRIVSTVSANKRGSYHSRQFLHEDAQNKHKNSIVPLESKTKQQVYDETTEMLVGLGVCITASSCWTDVTSNVGRFLKLANPSIHTYPIDSPLDLNKKAHPAFGI